MGLFSLPNGVYLVTAIGKTIALWGKPHWLMRKNFDNRNGVCRYVGHVSLNAEISKESEGSVENHLETSREYFWPSSSKSCLFKGASIRVTISVEEFEMSWELKI